MEQDLSDNLSAGDTPLTVDRLLRGQDRLTVLRAELESFDPDFCSGN